MAFPDVGGCQTHFLVLEGHEGTLAGLWRQWEGFIGVCGCRWEYGRGQACHLRVCFHFAWRRCFVECEMPGNCFPFNHRVQICGCDQRRQGSSLALFPTLTTFCHGFRANDTFFRQPVSDSPHKRPPVSRQNQTHRHMIPFHPLDRWKWLFTAHLLPYQWHGSRCSHQSLALAKGQAFCKGIRAHISLRGSVGNELATCSEPLCSFSYVLLTISYSSTWYMSLAVSPLGRDHYTYRILLIFYASAETPLSRLPTKPLRWARLLYFTLPLLILYLAVLYLGTSIQSFAYQTAELYRI